MTPPAVQPPHLLQARLAHALLRKAERSQGERIITLKLDAAVLPELHLAESPDTQAHLGLLLAQLNNTGWVTLRLAKARPFQTLAERDPTLLLLDAAALAEWSGFTPTPPKWSRQRVEALRAPGLLQVPHPSALLDYLLRSPLPWFEHQPAAACAEALNALAMECAAGHASYLRELSARHFQGHSKVLDAREELLRLLGASGGQFREAPIQLLVSLPPGGPMEPSFDDVLFIENLVSFERMAGHRHADWAQTALVYASGFKGTARRLRTREGSSLYWRDAAVAAGASEAFTQWLYDASAALPHPVRVSFYGDLDLSGMHILAQLRQSFPACQAWQPGYTALLKSLQDGHSHAPPQAAKEGQIDPASTGCDFADTILLPALRRSGHCVDQELWPAPPTQGTVTGNA